MHDFQAQRHAAVESAGKIVAKKLNELEVVNGQLIEVRRGLRLKLDEPGHELQQRTEELRLSQGRNKGRSDRAIGLEEVINGMTMIQVQKECKSHEMCIDGRIADLRLRLMLELAGNQ